MRRGDNGSFSHDQLPERRVSLLRLLFAFIIEPYVSVA